MIAIIDYGVGNLFSLKSSLKEIGAEVYVTKECGAVLTYIQHGKIYTESFLQE
jgi:imidazoleglycerol phosphate synthase glutamine amidotransferase subunit HisH